jgi:hypothetical protein
MPRRPSRGAKPSRSGGRYRGYKGAALWRVVVFRTEGIPFEHNHVMLRRSAEASQIQTQCLVVERDPSQAHIVPVLVREDHIYMSC